MAEEDEEEGNTVAMQPHDSCENHCCYALKPENQLQEKLLMNNSGRVET